MTTIDEKEIEITGETVGDEEEKEEGSVRE